MIEIQESYFYWNTEFKSIFLTDYDNDSEVFDQLYAQLMGWA